jgi:hypothetical protein
LPPYYNLRLPEDVLVETCSRHETPLARDDDRDTQAMTHIKGIRRLFSVPPSGK